MPPWDIVCPKQITHINPTQHTEYLISIFVHTDMNHDLLGVKNLERIHNRSYVNVMYSFLEIFYDEQEKGSGS